MVSLYLISKNLPFFSPFRTFVSASLGRDKERKVEERGGRRGGGGAELAQDLEPHQMYVLWVCLKIHWLKIFS